ncbi:hypothetical protein LTR95_018697, partial [Oleoguttula sp. CCFEE 5521]
RFQDIVVMERFLRNLGKRHGGVKGCEWTWSVHEAVRRFGVAMVGMKVDIKSLSQSDLGELDLWVTQEQARLGHGSGANRQPYGQPYDTASTTEQAAPHQSADGASLAGGAGKMPQTSGGGASAEAGSFTSDVSAPTFNSSAFAAFGQQQPTPQGTASSGTFPAPTPQQPGTGNPPPPAFFNTTSSQQAGTSTTSSSAQPVPDTTSAQPAQTQTHPQTHSTSFGGLAASKFASQNAGSATSQPVGPSGSSTASTTLTTTAAPQTGISGASQVAGAPGAGLGGQTGPASASSVNGTPGPGVSTFGAQSAGLVAGGQYIWQQGGQTGAPLVSNFTGTGGFETQTTAAGTASASGFGTTAANTFNPAPTPAPTPAPSVPNPSSFSDNKSAGLTPASLDMLQKGVRPVLNHEAGRKLRTFTDQIAQEYVSEYFITARREIEELHTYMADSVNLKAILRDTS